MSATIIDGKGTAERVRNELAEEVAGLAGRGLVPGLAVVLVGEDPASQIYVGGKEKACAATGILSERIDLPAETTQEALLGLVGDLNQRRNIHGVLVQFPLPDHLDEDAVIRAIDPRKDVDGLHPENVGKLVMGQKSFVPCTPQGCMVLLDEIGYDLTGAEAVIVGRSKLVGKPMIPLLLSKNATVTVCHTRTRDLAHHTGRADVLVVAAGRPEVITGDQIKEGAVVIDVGINRVDGKLVGDVEFSSAAERASAITPVPGGVGPMTIAMLLRNTVEAARRQTGIE